MKNVENFEVEDILIQLEKINYDLIINLLSPIITFYTGFKLSNTYRLYKEFKPSNINVFLPPQLTNNNLTIDFNKIVSKTMIENFSSDDLLIFYNNLNDLTIETKKFKEKNTTFKFNTLGTYNGEKNLICLDDDAYEATMYHELFHMSSSINNDEIYFSGFKQGYLVNNENICLGVALTEGYTQLLTERYFSDIKFKNHSYVFEKQIVYELEQIVGRKKMESLYLHANLSGLIEELKQYTQEEQIIEFITKFDFLKSHLVTQNQAFFEDKVIINSLKVVKEFLLKTYIIKINKYLKEGLISIEQFNNNLIKYASELGNMLIVGKKQYKYLTAGSFQKILKDALNTSNAEIRKI